MSRTVSSAQQEGERNRDEGTSRLAGGISEYEMERRRTMERNHRRLQELGLVGQGKVAMAGTALKTPKRGARSSAASAAAPVAVAVRKSLRTRSKPAPVYTDNAVGFDDEATRGRKRSRAPSLVGLQGSASQSPPVIASPPAPRRSASKPLPPDSSRNLECDIAMLMKQYLGKRFPSFGKAPVMELSTKSCPPRFSRMSGVTEWKNAVFLWVNVDGGTSYENLFEGSLDEQAPAGNGDASKNLVAATAGKPKTSSVALPAARTEDNEAGNAVPLSDRSSLDATGDASQRQSLPRAGGASNVGGDCDGDAVEDTPRNVGSCVAVGDDAHGGGVGRLPGIRMTWFAGGRMTAESALIRRLLPHGGSPESEERPYCTTDDADAGEATSGEGKPAVSHDAGLGGADKASGERKIDPARPATSAPLAEPDGPSRSSTASLPVGPGAGSNGMKVPEDVNVDGAPRSVTAGANEGGAVVSGSVPESSGSARQPTSGGEDVEADTVLLFCRLPSEPYVFCGRLGYSKHWSAERPVRFVWRLLDAGGLAGCPDFRAIVEAAGIGIASTKETQNIVE